MYAVYIRNVKIPSSIPTMYNLSLMVKLIMTSSLDLGLNLICKQVIRTSQAADENLYGSILSVQLILLHLKTYYLHMMISPHCSLNIELSSNNTDILNIYIYIIINLCVNRTTSIVHIAHKFPRPYT